MGRRELGYQIYEEFGRFPTSFIHILLLLDKIDEKYRKCIMPIYLLIIMFLRLINKIACGARKTRQMSKSALRSLTEEWPFFECKLTLIGTFVLFVAILITVVTDFGFPMRLGYELLIQSFVALLAVVPAVSLAVMEISASSYSIKLSRIYRKSIYFWYLVVLYITIIIMSMFGLLYSDQNISTTALNTLTTELAMFGVLYIIPYFLATMRLLHPEKAIQKLGQQIRAESLTLIVERKPVSLIPPPEDPLYPLLDIALQAMNRRDIELLRLALDETVRRYAKVLTFLENQRPIQKSTATEVITETMFSHKMREVIEHFLNHLRTLVKVSFEQKDEQNVICMIEYFGSFCKETMNYRFIEARASGTNRPAFSWIYEISSLGGKCSVLGFWDGVACSLRVLSNLSDEAMRRKYHGLQHSIASFVKDLFTIAMKNRLIPVHFIPAVAFESMSSVIEGKMKYGIYDINLHYQISDMNSISLEVIDKTANSIYDIRMAVLSRCYERMLSIALFDFYREKGKNPKKVAKVIYETLQIQAPYMLTTLRFLLEDRGVRRVSYPQFNYSPKQAIEDLLENGLGRNAIRASGSNKMIYVREICTDIQEISRIFYKLRDEEIVDKVLNILFRVHRSSKDPKDFRVADIEMSLCAMGYGALYEDLKTSALRVMTYLETLAVSEVESFSQPEKAIRIAMLVAYLGAAAIDFGMTDVADQALKKLIKFEEKYVNVHGGLPTLNHMSLLVRNYPVTARTWSRDDTYLSRNSRSWLFRLSSGHIDTLTYRKLLSDRAIDGFYSMYLANFLPKGY